MNDFSSDGFEALLGTQRGRTELQVMQELVAEQDMMLRELRSDLANARFEASAAQEAMAAAEGVLRITQFEAGRLRTHLQAATIGLLAQRYAVLGAGGRDPGEKLTEFVPRGLWTAGRPFLAGEHAVDPRTGSCHVARVGGAQRGERPGVSSQWSLCRRRCHDETLDGPLQAWPTPGMRLYLRQAEWWWEAGAAPRRLSELTDCHLVQSIHGLRRRASRMYDSEMTYSPRFTPCPVLAYSGPRAWVADTPLMRSLVAERRRRGLRAD